MVAPGVKGRPQACVTCHRRKKGCDLERPSCGQCRKACIPCGGYTRTAAPTKAALRAKAAAGKYGGSNNRSSEDAVTNIEVGSSSSSSSSSGSSTGHPTPLLPKLQPQPPTSVPPSYASPAPAARQHAVDNSSTPPGPLDASQKEPPRPPPSTAPPLPIPTSAPAPMISYPDLSGSLTLQPKYNYPSHFSASTSASDTYAVYNPGTSVTYFASNQPPSQSQDPSNDVDLRRRRNLLALRHHQHQHQQRAADMHLSTSISASAHHERLIGLFWEVFLPNARPLPTKTLGITLGGAVGAISSFDWNGDVLRRGLLAMAMTTVGKKQLQRLAGAPGSEDAERLRREGIRLYGKALQQMSQTLGKGGSRWTTEHWVTTRLFSLYEALYGADLQDHLAHRESWMVHSAGDIAFITSKPPTAYIADPAHTLFTAGRHHLVLYALLTRRRCILAEPAWKWVPWNEHPKSPRDLLLDIIIDVPAIYEAMDSVRSWPDEDDDDGTGKKGPGKGRKETARLMIRSGLTAIITRLQAWHDAHAMPTSPPSLSHPPPAAATPEQFLAGHVMTLFWATCIRLHNHERLLLLPGEFPDPRIDPDECCRSVVNVIRVFVQPSAGICRQHFTVYPMSTAMQHLIDVGPNRMVAERESLWADLNRPHCVLIKRFLLNMEPPRYRNEEEAKLGP